MEGAILRLYARQQDAALGRARRHDSWVFEVERAMGRRSAHAAGSERRLEAQIEPNPGVAAG